MYILGFNGYYRDNNDAGELSMEGVTYSTEQAGDYEVVTDVSVPLAGGMSQYYYHNVYIYVPAMSNLNGEINGIYFENGTFSVKSIVTMYWDSLTRLGEEQGGSKSMQISAEVAEKTSSPSYTVSVPDSIAMGSLEQNSDNIQPYDISVSRTDKEGVVTVSAPEGGILYSGSNTLAFSNDFGTQTFDASEESAARSGEETVLRGNIIIAGEAVSAAAAGNYTGTTTFTISYNRESADPDDPQEPSGDGTLDIRNLEDGVYAVTGTMVKMDKETYSMSNNAINHTIKLTVKDGKYYLTIDFHGLDIGTSYGYLNRMKYFLSGYTTDQYGNLQGGTADVTVDSYQLNSDGSRVSDAYGTDYPDLVTFEMIPEALDDGYVPLQVFVPVMEAMASGTGTQPVYLSLNWSSIRKTTEDDPALRAMETTATAGATITAEIIMEIIRAAVLA